jgi:hypothetical protein
MLEQAQRMSHGVYLRMVSPFLDYYVLPAEIGRTFPTCAEESQQ